MANVSNLKKNPKDWKSGEERATDAQKKSYIETMASELNEKVRTDVTKAEAAKIIEGLQRRTGRL